MTSCCWSRHLVNQEMVLRLAPSPARPRAADPGQVRQVLGAFEIGGLFLLNALTIVTEFIANTLAAGTSRAEVIAVLLAAAVIISTPSLAASPVRAGRDDAVRRVLLLLPLYPAFPPVGGADGRPGFAVPECR